MKTIEQKAKAYDDALQVAKNALECEEQGLVTTDKVLIEKIFPELKENEDDRIRKEIVDFICWATDRGSITKEQTKKSNDWLAWLEKQGEQMSDPRYSILNKLIEADDIYQMSVNDTMVEEAKNKAIETLSKLEISKLLGLEKQGEQNHANSTKTCEDEQKTTDKVEPKFKKD